MRTQVSVIEWVLNPLINDFGPSRSKTIEIGVRIGRCEKAIRSTKSNTQGRLSIICVQKWDRHGWFTVIRIRITWNDKIAKISIHDIDKVYYISFVMWHKACSTVGLWKCSLCPKILQQKRACTATWLSRVCLHFKHAYFLMPVNLFESMRASYLIKSNLHCKKKNNVDYSCLFTAWKTRVRSQQGLCQF